MAVKVIGKNVVLFKVDTTTDPVIEFPFACSTSCTFTSNTETYQIASPTNAWFTHSQNDLSNWQMSCDGLVTLEQFSYVDLAYYQKNRITFLVRFELDNGIDGFKYVSGYAFIGGYSISGPYKEAGTYSVQLVGTGKYYTEKTPTTTTTTTSTSTSTTTSTTSTTRPPLNFTYFTSCSVLRGYITISSITGGTGTGYQFRNDSFPSVWYNYPANDMIGDLDDGNHVISVRDSSGTIVSKTIATLCVNTTTIAPTTTIPPVYYSLERCGDGAAFHSTAMVYGSIPVYGSPPYARVYGFVGPNNYAFQVVGQSYTEPSGTAVSVAYIAGQTGCPITTTLEPATTTLAPVTCTLTAVCTGNTQTITLSNFAGGDGVYYANDITYDNPVSAAAGNVSIVTGGVRVYTNVPAGSSNYTRYIYVTSGYRNTMKQGGVNCSTTTSTTTTTTTTTTYKNYVYLGVECNTGDTFNFYSQDGSRDGKMLQSGSACYSLTLLDKGSASIPLPSGTFKASCSDCTI